MSQTEIRDALRPVAVTKVTPQTLLQGKRALTPLTALTAYDYPTARLADEAGIDMILVGDSVGTAVLGYDNTLCVTMDDMLHHARAVRRGTQRALLVVDMPYGSYQVSAEDAVRNGLRFFKECGSEAVKLEGGIAYAPQVKALTQAEIPVVGHIGLTPQSVHRMGGYRVQGLSETAAKRLREDANALEEAGAIALVLEGIPRELAAQITASVSIPTIGIGAGPDCDGQILVFHDLFSLSYMRKPKFVRSFGDGRLLMEQGIRDFRDAVVARTFPNDLESYHMPKAEVAAERYGASAEQTEVSACK